MKSKLVILAFAAFAFAACSSSTPKAETKEETQQDSSMIAAESGDKVIYECPMHPEEVSDKPAQCSKCGMDLEKVTIRGNDTVRAE
jgi:Cu+-exporting ATPase